MTKGEYLVCVYIYIWIAFLAGHESMYDFEGVAFQESQSIIAIVRIGPSNGNKIRVSNGSNKDRNSSNTSNIKKRDSSDNESNSNSSSNKNSRKIGNNSKPYDYPIVPFSM